jgi:hypothetical protein
VLLQKLTPLMVTAEEQVLEAQGALSLLPVDEQPVLQPVLDGVLLYWVVVVGALLDDVPLDVLEQPLVQPRF